MGMLTDLQRCLCEMWRGLRARKASPPPRLLPATLAVEALEDRTMPANLGILVPAYFSPTTDAADWAKMTAAAGQVQITAIMNPDSGPGTAKDAAYATAVNKLRAAGGQVLGYVATDYGAIPLATVKAEINDYYKWYHVDGIFIDQMATGGTAAQLKYYQQIDSYIHQVGGGNDVGNPGTTVPQSYLNQQAADELVLFENGASATVSNPYNSYQPPAWQQNHPASDFANIVYNVPTVAAMQTDVNLAVSNHTGWIYVTDGTLANNNPYAALPSYWTQLVTAVAAADGKH